MIAKVACSSVILLFLLNLFFAGSAVIPLRIRILVDEVDSDRIIYGRWPETEFPPIRTTAPPPQRLLQQQQQQQQKGMVRFYARGSQNRRVWPEDTVTNIISSRDSYKDPISRPGIGPSGNPRPQTGPSSNPVPGTGPSSNPRPGTGGNKSSDGPSPCVWAIVSCCDPSSTDINEECFKALGCSGPFWDGNPCHMELGMAAVNTGRKHFGANNYTDNEFEEIPF